MKGVVLLEERFLGIWIFTTHGRGEITSGEDEDFLDGGFSSKASCHFGSAVLVEFSSLIL
jgi:hypothetical protein